MKFINENFLLQSASARCLYFDYAENQPIIDYHSHLCPRLIAEDHRFSNLAEIWLQGDHYKWRAMRAAGIPERLITGDASDWDKFQAWAEVVPHTLRNPLYHWTHLELRTFFGIEDRLFDSDSAPEIWKRGNAILKEPEFSVRGILRKMNVKYLCTTDDPLDSLEFHKRIAEDSDFEVGVYPTFRPDKALSIPARTSGGSSQRSDCIRDYLHYLDRLGAVAGLNIGSFSDLVESLRVRHSYFHENGCRISDHGFGLFEFDEHVKASTAEKIFDKLRNEKTIDAGEEISFRSALLHEIGKMNAEKEWAMQLHLGALRNNNTRLLRELGPDCGCDSMIDGASAHALSRFLDSLDAIGQLPRMILYNLNPCENEMLATLIGNFQDGITPGKLQYGSGWWFLDQKQGMERQLDTISNQGLLGRFIGMLTDSRSFLSFSRHEYFRRILCNVLGAEMEQGLLPNDFELIGNLVQNICFKNAKEYFSIECGT